MILGAVAFGGTGGILGARSGSGDPEPPCPGGWFVGPRGTTCQRSAEVCRAYLNGQDSKTVACQVESPDGRGAVKGSIGGSGTVRLVVKDGGAATVHDRTYDFSEGLVPLADLRGASGTWMLSATFRAQGGADIYLWG